MGFSNGANIAATLLLRHPRLLRGAALFAPMVTLDDPPMVDASLPRPPPGWASFGRPSAPHHCPEPEVC
ncbi:MAG TPA: hypothetical protein VE673_03305 [Pseudonocardiaceae bacterium]|nr:hypothetical protein [Pseudonocardiaceae bacterium]